MSVKVRWNEDSTLSVDPPAKPKKMTATKFAAVLGLNPWSTPFQQWCEITRTYNEPFEDTKYTLAGKAIEPLQIQYMREAYGMGDELVEPSDIWGADYFKKTWGNFFSHPVVGGMWDAVCTDGEWDGSPEGLQGHVERVLEFKTTKRSEDWMGEDGEPAVPEYYALQAALYAWLLECDDVVMVCSFLKPSDYDDPEGYVPDASNTVTVEFSLSERYPSFEHDYLRPALVWWDDHVRTGISPAYDETADAEYLSALRRVSVDPGEGEGALLAELAALTAEMDAVADKARRLKQVKSALRSYAEERIGDAAEAVLAGSGVTCTLTRSVKRAVDEEAMERDGILDRYMVERETMRFTVKVD